MGSDIHGHLEVKVGGVWDHYNTPNIKRDYRLFGKLAGVRNEQIIPIHKPKGLPKDISTITRIDYNYWENDAHSCSWLNANELAAVIEWQKEQGEDTFDEWGYLFGNEWDKFNEYREDYPKEIEDIRFVFWFDN